MAIVTLNSVYYDKYIKNSPFLSSIKFEDETLIFKDGKTIELKTSNILATLPLEIFSIKSLNNFYDFVLINFNSDEEYKNIIEEDDSSRNDKQKMNFHLNPIRNILNKSEVSVEDLEFVKSFLKEYMNLVKANGYLGKAALLKLNEMSSILNWTLTDSNYIKTNYAQQLLRQYTMNLNDGNTDELNYIGEDTSSVKEAGISRSLMNPNVPKSGFLDDVFQSKAGVLSFIALLIVVINLVVILSALAVK